MSTRPIISYDDITLPYDQPETPLVNHPSSSSHAGTQPPSKKRKKNNHNNQKAKRRQDANASRNNGPGSQTPASQKFMNTTTNSVKTQPPPAAIHEEGGMEGEEGEYECGYEEEESRELTHEEIWDDSALVDAWDAAMEEYEAYHGTEQDWKKEPVKKSPLWYNIPFDPSKKPAAKALLNAAVGTTTATPPTAPSDGAETDSKPIDFDTFVPTHDPSLDIPSVPTPTAGELPTMPSEASYIPDSVAGSIVSQDEAFQRALTAMYWGGYWTAMYHSQRQLAQSQKSSTTSQKVAIPMHKEDNDEDEDEDGDQEDVDDGSAEIEVDEFIPTQR
ncbi:hypothetical protein JR316_0001300 [Psilocybe cubensis]|uniref:Survival Motor Neuron Gemin2-binding domain-containing protein n=2 Tax=Psilocybe cubensis TaxID=181762 RepID=A0A8H8CR58_PSICU|nr:hypothetical protein JR316_0001300 [Psilocybe cubensis]KAH9487231.1 hypothetical protein JR316_0001300 [Psilocybe cubensis]